MKRRDDFFLPAIVLDRGSSVPLHTQVRTQLAAAIGRDAASRGRRLPSTRILSRLLAVSRNTVLTAYEDLVAEGLVEGQHGSGMLISAERRSGALPFDPTSVLREAQYPARTMCLADADGNPLHLVY